MSDNAIELPAHTIEPIDEPEADSPLYVVAANGAEGELHTEIIDVRGQAPHAFAPRTAEPRIVTDTASFLAEIARRPLVSVLAKTEARQLPPTVPSGLISTAWGNRQAGEVTVVYDELPPEANGEYTRRADRLILRFVADPDWATFKKAADGQFHGQDEFGDMIEAAGHLITSHPAAELMEIVDSVRASSKGAFESKIRRDTGSQHLVYSEEVSTKAGSSQRPLEVPREIVLSARPFEDYPQVEVTCWLRLRINQGRLLLGLFPQPYEHKVRDAWTQVTHGISESLGVPVYASNLGR